MAKGKKYYAVQKGFIPGIYTSWEKCQQNINGFSGAKYKKFSTKEEAEAFLNNTDLDEDIVNNNNKPWYEKVSIWITIIAGISAILGVSIFGNRSLVKDDEIDGATTLFENNKVGDQSTVIVGDGNTINYGNTDSDNIKNSQIDNLSTTESDNFLVTASYDMNTPQTSTNGVNVLIEAETSFPAERVLITGISDNAKLDPTDMHGGLYKWQFVANFYIKGTYTITVTAYNSDGESVSDSFEYIY